MNFLRTYSCSVQKYYSYNSINSVIKRCSHILNKQEYDATPTTKSTLYPDYEVVYNFPYITYASSINKLKRNYTVFIGANIPIIGGLTMQNLVSIENAIGIGACSFTILATLHVICTLCNNLIGVIYHKEAEKKVIVSYLNYWGKRVDLPTDVNDVNLKTASKFHQLYRKLYVKSREKNFKLATKVGYVVEKSNFRDIFNNVE